MKYIVVQKGYGKYAKYRVKPVSDKELEKLEQGVKVYNSKPEAEKSAKRMK